MQKSNEQRLIDISKELETIHTDIEETKTTIKACLKLIRESKVFSASSEPQGSPQSNDNSVSNIRNMDKLKLEIDGILMLAEISRPLVNLLILILTFYLGLELGEYIY